MDLVLDLTAHAVSYISFIQDYVKYHLGLEDSGKLNEEHIELWDAYRIIKHQYELDSVLETRLKDLVFATQPQIYSNTFQSLFTSISSSLMNWLEKNISSNRDILFEKFPYESSSLNYAPNYWRLLISRELYHNSSSCLPLCDALFYMPVQIIYCLGANKLSLRKQRVIQVWNILSEDNMLNKVDKKFNERWWKSTIHNKMRSEIAKEMLVNRSSWVPGLISNSNAIPFESFFEDELKDISESRMIRVKTIQKEEPGKRVHSNNVMSLQGNSQSFNNLISTIKNDVTNGKMGQFESPYEKSASMNLFGVAFSGGGIRSATFNLGVLQKLAEYDILRYVDYLSTVSGGGYIGSWFISWIKESGSVDKVTKRLNITKSADPMGEEVRPVRWLRMYSNYLTPNVSIMSADAWTMGMTWLRNTIINLIILILLASIGLVFLFLFNKSWEQWSEYLEIHAGLSQVIWTSVLLQIPASIVAGIGMHMFNQNSSALYFLNFGRSKFFTSIFLSYCFLSAMVISLMITIVEDDRQSYWDIFQSTRIIGIAGFCCLFFTAMIGKYYEHWNSASLRLKGFVLLFISSIIAALIGHALLALVIYLYEHYETIYQLLNCYFWFIFGPPAILEIYAIVIVSRMAVMGNYFPDGRREWWGKMGGIFHRLSLNWIIINLAVFVLHKWIIHINNEILIPSGITWITIVGLAVKMAYNSSSSNPVKGVPVKEIFIRFAPYLFMGGFIILCSIITGPVKESLFSGPNLLKEFLVWLLLCGVIIFLGCRIGVNEFSLHYFYRNRLIRAFLGAVRRRPERSRSANPFTGFDDLDDHHLKLFRPMQKYYGPYPLINTSLNCSVVSDLDRQDRKAESFIFSPLFCGFDVSPTRSAAFNKNNSFDYGYRPTESYAYEEGPTLGTAMAISGAAVNPNMGYHSSPGTAFLLTIFNVRLGWWIGNPRLDKWRSSDPYFGIAYLIQDLLGKSNTNSEYVCLSDGGHFDNMGIYELIRRRCKYILLSDAEEDPNEICEGLANAIRRCYIDFGAVINIPMDKILHDKKVHVIYGTIRYGGEMQPSGILIYVKACLTGDESTDLREYKKKNAFFPHQSTADQFYDEAQFESYRKLGWHSLDQPFNK